MTSERNAKDPALSLDLNGNEDLLSERSGSDVNEEGDHLRVWQLLCLTAHY